jgi:DNA processing protein
MFFSEAGEKLLALSRLKGIGEKTLSSLKNETNFNEMTIEDITSKCLSKKNNYSKLELDNALDFAKKQSELCISNNISLHTLFDHDFPYSLQNLDTPPPFFFCKGNYSSLNEKNVAVIGTRQPTARGEEIGKRITEWLISNGFNIVSGLAFGIDSIAHRKTLDLHGKTIAVMAHGLDSIYPKANESLASEILEKQGALVSEYPVGAKVNPINLVKRDAIQAALSSGVFLIQTGIKGGSLHASRAILQYGRPLVVVGQARTDINNKEEKIQGNFELLNSDHTKIKSILKLNDFDKNILVKLNSSSDYDNTLALLHKFIFNSMSKNNKIDGLGF